jgi:hypothetical protein
VKTNVIIHQSISVEFDERKFTKAFMDNFRRYFYNFETVAQHIEHIATCYARGLIADESSFLEGYGRLDEFGIRIKREEVWADNE